MNSGTSLNASLASIANDLRSLHNACIALMSSQCSQIPSADDVQPGADFNQVSALVTSDVCIHTVQISNECWIV